MKQIILLFTISLILFSCKSKMADITSEENIIVNQMLLIAKPNYTILNLLTKPDNDLILNFKDGGFQDDNHTTYQNKFIFKDDKKTKWNKDISIDNKQTKYRFNFIEDFDKIEKVSSNETEKSKVILSISNVMFSDNGEYAIVNINTFSNFISADYYEGRIYIFKKEGNKWVYVSDFMAAIS